MGVTMSWFLVLKSLLAVCIISYLSVSSVESYGCVRKTCINGRCDPNPNTCESSKGCFSQRQEVEVETIQPSKQIFEEKGCSEDGCTELAFSATLGKCRTFRFDRQCCYTQRCNRDPIKVSSLSSEPNGVECPTCYSEQGSCNPVPLKCTGAETTCVNITGRGRPENSYLVEIHGMGCATKTACGLKNRTVLGIQIHTSCFSGSPPPLRPVLSVLTSLFLVKALL